MCYPNLSATAPHKLSPRSVLCVFLGYSAHDKGYCCLDLSTNKVIISCHVIFDESSFPSAEQHSQHVSSADFEFLDTTAPIGPSQPLVVAGIPPRCAGSSPLLAERSPVASSSPLLTERSPASLYHGTPAPVVEGAPASPQPCAAPNAALPHTAPGGSTISPAGTTQPRAAGVLSGADWVPLVRDIQQVYTRRAPRVPPGFAPLPEPSSSR